MLRRTATLSILICALVLAVVSPASAITYGQPDGNLHPFVGALVGTFNGQTYPYCSGTLIAPTVFLTAAHCNIGSSTVYVTFDSVYSAKSPLIQGSFYGDPQYTYRQNDAHDVAVVVLSKAVTKLGYGQLPTAGQLDQLPHDQAFTAVGYGGTEPINQPGGPVIHYPDIRMYAVSTLNAINPTWLRLSQNQATGDGGTCYGDSGGPNFLGDSNLIAAVTITGDSLCKATNVVYRLDTVSAREFLSNYVSLP